MSKFGSLIGRKASVPVVGDKGDKGAKAGADKADSIESLSAEKVVAEILAAAPMEIDKPSKNVVEMDQELFLPVATQLGEENESIRNLLIEAEHKLNELDAIKRSIGRLIDPVGKTLRALEEARSEKIALQASLNNTRVTSSSLRNELNETQKRAAALEAECARLREASTVAQQRINSLESTKTEQTTELTARRTQVADLQRRVQQQSADLQAVREENRRLSERVTLGDKQTVQLESEREALQQKLLVAEKERATLQKSLDKSFVELTTVSQRLLDTDKALAATQLRMQKAEQQLAETEAQRHRASTALDDANQKHQSEMIAQRTAYETLQARALLTEKLLDEARQNLLERAEEIRAFDRRLSDSTRTHSVIGEKLGLIEEALAERNTKIKELEAARAALAEENDTLSKAVNTRESAYNRAQEHIATLEEKIQLLENEVKATRQANETELEVLNAKLQREQIARTVAEGALEAGRKDIARLVQEVASLQYRPSGVASGASSAPATSSAQAASTGSSSPKPAAELPPAELNQDPPKPKSAAAA
jgi:crescentin